MRCRQSFVAAGQSLRVAQSLSVPATQLTAVNDANFGACGLRQLQLLVASGVDFADRV
jgi:hypothetical protein